MIAMLLMMAAQAAPGTQFSAVATARIVPGTRISFVEEKVWQGVAEPHRRVVIRDESGQARQVRLLEFQ